MRFRVSHSTHYEYSEPVSLCHSIAHLKPRTSTHQRCLSSQVRVDPWPAVNRDHEDFFGNRVSYYSIQQSHSALEITAVSEVEVNGPELPDPTASAPWELVVERLRSHRDPRINCARIFTLPSPQVPLDADAVAFAASSFPAGRPVLEATLDLMGRIFAGVRVRPALHHHRHAGRRGRRAPPRGLPGLRAPRNCWPARARARGPLCQRLPGDLAPSRPAQAPGKRRVACLVLPAGAGPRLGRLRPHQQPDTERPAHHHGDRPRLSGRHAGAGHFLRRRDPRAAGRGRRGPTTAACLTGRP